MQGFVRRGQLAFKSHRWIASWWIYRQPGIVECRDGSGTAIESLRRR